MHKKKVMIEESDRTSVYENEQADALSDGIDFERGKEDISEVGGRILNIDNFDRSPLRMPKLEISSKDSKDKPLSKGEGSRRNSRENSESDSISFTL